MGGMAGGGKVKGRVRGKVDGMARRRERSGKSRTPAVTPAGVAEIGGSIDHGKASQGLPAGGKAYFT
jgi:hypothetical protein